MAVFGTKGMSITDGSVNMRVSGESLSILVIAIHGFGDFGIYIV